MTIPPGLTETIAKERDVKEFDWTRRGPLPDAPQRRVPDRSSFGRNMDNLSDAGSERGGSRRGGFESDGKIRDFGNWERKGPLSPTGPPAREGRPRTNEGGPGFRRGSPAWGEGRSQDGSRPPRREFQERAPTAAEMDNSWRSRMRPDQPKEPSNPPSPAAAPAAPVPASRPRLNLQKRTVPEATATPAGGEAKASIFGGARPIDTATREREVEERRQLAIRQKKEADEKARAEKAEKEKSEKTEKTEKPRAKDQAKTEKAAESTDKDAAEAPQAATNFEILRRAGEDESGMTADQDQSEETTAAATATEAAPSKANGSWRNAQPEAAAADDEGWSTVSSSRQRNNRRGQGGRSFA